MATDENEEKTSVEIEEAQRRKKFYKQQNKIPFYWAIGIGLILGYSWYSEWPFALIRAYVPLNALILIAAFRVVYWVFWQWKGRELAEKYEAAHGKVLYEPIDHKKIIPKLKNFVWEVWHNRCIVIGTECEPKFGEGSTRPYNAYYKLRIYSNRTGGYTIPAIIKYSGIFKNFTEYNDNYDALSRTTRTMGWSGVPKYETTGKGEQSIIQPQAVILKPMVHTKKEEEEEEEEEGGGP